MILPANTSVGQCAPTKILEITTIEPAKSQMAFPFLEEDMRNNSAARENAEAECPDGNECLYSIGPIIWILDFARIPAGLVN